MKIVLKQIMILTLLLSSFLIASKVKVKVSSTRIVPGQSLKVKLIAQGDKVKFPDIQKIASYPVESIRRASDIESRFINGELITKNQKILSFEIYPDKNLTIPSMSVEVDGKSYTTTPIKVEVTKVKVGSAGSFEIHISTDKKSIFQGEPFIVTIDAIEPLNNKSVQMQYTPPVFKDFFVKALGGEKQIHKKNKIIHRLSYLLTPQKAGILHVDSALLRIGTRDLSAPYDPFGIFGSPIRWSTLRSNSVKISVKPLPISADLVGDFKVKSTVDKTKVKANKPVNYTLEIFGEGSLEDLSDPVFDIPGATVYSDDAVIKSEVKNGKLYSHWIKKYVFISDQDFIIPSLKLVEFNYKTKKKKILKTKKFSIYVKGGVKHSTTNSISKAKVITGTKVNSSKQNLFDDPAYYAKKEYEAKMKRVPWYILEAFVAGMGLMFLLMILFRRKGKRVIKRILSKQHHYSKEEAFSILYPHVNEDPNVEAIVRLLLMQREGQRVEINQEILDKLASKYDNPDSNEN